MIFKKFRNWYKINVFFLNHRKSTNFEFCDYSIDRSLDLILKYTSCKFFHGYLQRRKWPEKHQTTQDLLIQHCNCKDERIYIGKKRPSVMIVDAFEKPENVYKPKQLKPKDPF